MRVVIDGVQYVPASQDADSLELNALRQEREDVIKLLRTECATHGDNDWPDDLHLHDILVKHLFDYLDQDESEERWTLQKPRENGFYWLKSYTINSRGEIHRTPVIVHVYSSFGENPSVTFTGTDACFSLDAFAGEEWLGPLNPEIIEKQKEQDAQIAEG